MVGDGVVEGVGGFEGDLVGVGVGDGVDECEGVEVCEFHCAAAGQARSSSSSRDRDRDRDRERGRCGERLCENPRDKR
jgi:hypothetical protein